jgi:hypothetical protein
MSPCTCHTPRSNPPTPPPPPPPPFAPPEPASFPGFAFWVSRSVWGNFGQAEEAVANLPLRLAVRVRCSQPSFAGYSRGTRSLQGHTVLTPYSRGAHSLYWYTATGQHAAGDALSAERAVPSFSCLLERVRQ